MAQHTVAIDEFDLSLRKGFIEKLVAKIDIL